MKLKKLLSIALLIPLSSSFAAIPDPCLCYCSYKPGPREAMGDDAPEIVNTKKLQPDSQLEYNICFCKQRDIDKFADEPAIIEKVKQEDLDQLTCCDDENQFYGDVEELFEAVGSDF